MCKGKENIEAVIAETDNKREHFICTPVYEMLSKEKKKKGCKKPRSDYGNQCTAITEIDVQALICRALQK